MASIRKEEWYEKAIEKKVREELKKNSCTETDYQLLKNFRYLEQKTRRMIEDTQDIRDNLAVRKSDVEKALKWLKIEELPSEHKQQAYDILVKENIKDEEEAKEAIRQLQEDIEKNTNTNIGLKKIKESYNGQLKFLEKKCGFTVLPEKIPEKESK